MFRLRRQLLLLLLLLVQPRAALRKGVAGLWSLYVYCANERVVRLVVIVQLLKSPAGSLSFVRSRVSVGWLLLAAPGLRSRVSSSRC